MREAEKLARVSARPDLTGLLQAWSRGDGDALAALAPLVQQELREIARRILAAERRDGRWRPTELVQESYLRLLDWRNVQWQSRAHFFKTPARRPAPSAPQPSLPPELVVSSLPPSASAPVNITARFSFRRQID